MPRFTYTKHVTIKMVERGIPPDAVEAVVLESEERYVDFRHGTLIAVRRGEEPLVWPTGLRTTR